jgi:hypothetical protein
MDADAADFFGLGNRAGEFDGFFAVFGVTDACAQAVFHNPSLPQVFYAQAGFFWDTADWHTADHGFRERFHNRKFALTGCRGLLFSLGELFDAMELDFVEDDRFP